MSGDELEKHLNYLQKKELRIVTAESATSGMAASILSDVPGSGAWLECGLTTYSETSKVKILGIDEKVLRDNNLTSEPVAKAMVEGALRLMSPHANIGISNTGVAGPGKGDGGVQPGTICFGWAFDVDGRKHTYTETKRFDGDRNEVRKQAAHYSIEGAEKYHRKICGRGEFEL